MGEELHERSTVDVRAVAIGAAAIAAGVLAALLAARALLKTVGEPPPAVVGEPFTRAAGPTLEITPREDLQQFRAEERQKLEQYRLVDEKGGVVRIPVERAMSRLAQEHAEAAQQERSPR